MNASTTTESYGRKVTERLVASEFLVLVLCLTLALVFIPIAPGFATVANLSNLVEGCLPLLLLATGQTFVLITGGIDLSAASTVGLSSIVGALVMSGDQGWLRGNPVAMPVAVLAMLATGVLVGGFNGLCVVRFRMPAFMVTLTSMMFLGGFAVWLAKRFANTETLYNLPAPFIAIGHQAGLGIAITLGMSVVAHVLLSRTLWGRWLQATGSNPRASFVSGVPVGHVTALAYMLSGFFAALASILLTARLETSSANHGKTLLLDVVGAAVLGGTSLFGGKGKVIWTVYGVAFLSVLGNGLNLLNLSDFLITIAKGLVILFAALLDVWRNQFSIRRS